MARRCIATWSAVLALALTVMVATVVPVAAVPDTCPVAGADSIAVSVSSPGDGDRVGGMVKVRGRAVSEDEIFQVDLLVGDSRRDRMTVDPPSSTVDFELSWDADATPSDNPVDHVLSIVACGGEPDQARLLRGSRSLRVTVEANAGAGPQPLAGTAPKREQTRPTRPWVGAVIIVPSLIGLAYSLGARSRAARRAAELSREAVAPSPSPD